ncbi:hypothetical protein GMORB2_3316 [Geosmithia morbida]|uniref:RFX-type winged-helix domain-containing protein n=1 Tax=Geosmithia morbida TaxID=1094350 RepID=A0A9P4YR09_9HYPO|nr:uncharacterized protein GMORB2_3316 [Geosmithia morbida]KAF4120189.1 hypothetical protein GMORB2_3316 [Geosmithia morbida]
MQQVDSATAHPSARPKMRPQSRASTTSAHSVTTQPNLDHASFADMSGLYAGQWQDHHHAAAQQGQHPIGPEDMLVQAIPHMQATAGDYAMADAMGAPMAHHPQHHQHQHPQQQQHHQQQQQQQHMAFNPHQVPPQHHHPAHQVNWGHEDARMMAAHEDMSASQTPVDPVGANTASGKPSRKKSNANNDGEMRDLFSTNRGRPLDDVAKDLRGNERGPQAERKRQLYAMLWLNSACVESKNSIPRGRVYHMYASRCSDDRVMVLNPASFGKLVRVVFPAIKTRRLGVRGESKYHYCHFDLREPPPPELVDEIPRNSLPAPDTAVPTGQPSLTFPCSTAPAQTQDDTGHGVFPSTEMPVDSRPRRSSSQNKRGSRIHSRYNTLHMTRNSDGGNSVSTKTPLKLEFMTEEDMAADSSEPVVLPRIGPFLPPNTDQDAAQSLVALYRSQCTSIIESFRYCREKNFFHLYTSFHGTLTMPVQKLFANPSIAPWIEECDVVLYQRLTRLVVQLSLQAIPKPVINRMHTIATRLVSHIRDAFHGQPAHVIEAKVGPATIFAGILERMLRVNLTAHAAANSMAVGANRDQMFADWVKTINPHKIAECVPTQGMDDTVWLLSDAIKDLVDPETLPIDEDPFSLFNSAQVGGDGSSDAGSCVERWRKFLMSLPSKFPYASHADIAWCVERVGSAVMRDLTIYESPSFSAWWVAKTFFDEMVWFLAEVGGFFRTKSLRRETREASATAAATASEQQQVFTDRRSADQSMTMDHMDISQDRPLTANNNIQNINNASSTAVASPGNSDRAPFPPKPSQQPVLDAAGDLPEDSGIGIRTPETDLPMDKYTTFGVENSELAE